MAHIRDLLSLPKCGLWYRAGLAGADAERDAVTVTYANGQRVLLASVGKKVTLEGVRKATVAAVGRLRALKVTAVELALPTVEGTAPAK